MKDKGFWDGFWTVLNFLPYAAGITVAVCLVIFIALGGLFILEIVRTKLAGLF